MNNYQDEVVARFDSYVKTSLRHCIYNMGIKRKKIEENESLCTEDEILHIKIEDDYDFIENYIKVLGVDVMIRNDLLYEALLQLEPHQIDIIFLSACENWSDRKIAEKLNMSRSKVQRLKMAVLHKLKRSLGVVDDESKQ